MPAERKRSTRYTGRGPKASEERTRGRAARVGRLWEFDVAAGLASDGVARIAGSWKALMIAD